MDALHHTGQRVRNPISTHSEAGPQWDRAREKQRDPTADWEQTLVRAMITAQVIMQMWVWALMKPWPTSMSVASIVSSTWPAFGPRPLSRRDRVAVGER